MIIFIISVARFQYFLADGFLIAVSSSFTFFAGSLMSHAGTMYSLDCSVERFLLSHCSDLFDP